MSSDIWNDGTIERLVGRYVSYTCCSGKLRHEGILIAVEYVTRTLTLAEKSLATNGGNKVHVTGGYEPPIALQTVPWAKGDDVKMIDLNSSDDTLDELIERKNFITTEILNYRQKPVQPTDNLWLQVVQLSTKQYPCRPITPDHLTTTTI